MSPRQILTLGTALGLASGLGLGIALGQQSPPTENKGVSVGKTALLTWVPKSRACRVANSVCGL
jgi:hypothetical protein